MTRFALLALAAGLAGCFISYDPESIPPLQGTGLALGTACGGDPQCQSGRCVDGVCCDDACSGQCEACDLPGSEGSCLPVTGAPRGARAACADDGSGCGGTCNGTLTSTCDYPATVCRAQSCSGATQSYPAYCTSGACPASATLACDPFVCGPTACKNSCFGDGDCVSGNYCAAGSCLPKAAAGVACGAANQCLSGFCSPDGRCCDAACTGSCESCNGVNTGQPAGTCAPLLAGSLPDPTHTPCAGSASSTCAGACDGFTRAVCAYPTVECRPAECALGVEIQAAACDTGSCPAIVTAACAPYACGATACKTTCSSNADCDANSWCSGTSCVAKKVLGAACGDAGQCASGTCADGVCCSGPCGGCRACNLAGYVGTCTNVPAGQDPHGACTITSCQTSCNGSGSCATAPNGEYCGSNSCVNGTPDAFDRPVSATANVAWCGGAVQVCPVPSHPGASCNGHTCDGAQCNLTCLDNSDCISGTLCVAGRCQYCASNADCNPGAPQCGVGLFGNVCECPGDPTCADAICGSPGDCQAAGFGSVCALYYDVCQCTTGDKCNGRAPRCSGAPGSCSCGATAGKLCAVGQLCTGTSLADACKAAPGFPCSLGTTCASGSCTGGFCDRLVAGRPCTRGADCQSGACNASWVCN